MFSFLLPVIPYVVKTQSPFVCEPAPDTLRSSIGVMCKRFMFEALPVVRILNTILPACLCVRITLTMLAVQLILMLFVVPFTLVHLVVVRVQGWVVLLCCYWFGHRLREYPVLLG